ncbi:hypothetical protein NL676_008241 [Syzygium grande]|nr:hypothetical protein NL676_008241 [Syzygium grande]
MVKLVELRLFDCAGCKSLPPLGELTSLKRLEIGALPIMEYTESDLHTLSSLPNLSALSIWESPNLERIPPLLQLKELKLPSFPLESLQTSVATIELVIGIDDRVKDVIKLLEIEDDGATGQVPYAIEVISSFLRGKTIEDWRKIQDLIKPRKENSREILKDCREILKFCYEALDEKQKQIFWDIAWFANGMDSEFALYMWPDRDFLPSHHVLMPLAKIGEDNVLWMHKLLKLLSGTIDQEEPRYTVRHSRLHIDDTDLTVINPKEVKVFGSTVFAFFCKVKALTYKV